MDPQDLLYTNEFLNTNLISDKDLLENTQYYNRFTDYIEKKTVSETQNYLNDDEKESSLVNIDKNLYTKWPIYNNKNHYPLFDSYINDISSNRYKKNILTRISIDSRNRDITNFLYPYSFSLTLPSVINNITKIYMNDIILANINQTITNTNNALAWQYASKNYLLQNGIDDTIIPVPDQLERNISYSKLPNSVFKYTTENSDVNYVASVDNYLVYQTSIIAGNYTIETLAFGIRDATNKVLHGNNSTVLNSNNIKVIEEPYLSNQKRINTPHLFSVEINPVTNQVRFVNRIEEVKIVAIQTFSPYEDNFIETDMFYKFSIARSNVDTSFDLDTNLIYITVAASNDITYQYYSNQYCVYSPNSFPLVITDLKTNIGNILFDSLNFTVFFDLTMYLNEGYNEDELESICYYKFIDVIILRNNYYDSKYENIGSRAKYLRFGLHLSNGMLNGNLYNKFGRTIRPSITENIVFSSKINDFFTSFNSNIYPVIIKTTSTEKSIVFNSTPGLLVEYSYSKQSIDPVIGRSLLFRWIFDLDNGNYVDYEYRTVNVKKRSLLNILAWSIGNVTNSIIVKQINNGYNFVLTNYQSTILNEQLQNPFTVVENNSQIQLYYPTTSLSLTFYNDRYYFSNSNYAYIKLSGNVSFGQNDSQLLKSFSLDSLQYEQNYVLNSEFKVGIGEDYTYLTTCNTLKVYQKDYNGLFAKVLLCPVVGNIDLITNNIINNSNVFTLYNGLINNLDQINVDVFDSNLEILSTTQNFSFTLNIEKDVNVLKETNIDTTTNNVNSTSHYI